MPPAARADDQTLVPLGPLVKLHGRHGELRLLLFNPASQTLRAGSAVVLRRDGACQPARVQTLRPHKQFLLVTLEGCTSMTAAEQLIGSEVCVPERDLPPIGPQEVYHYQLKGMTVVTTSGTEIGIIADVLPTAGHDVCVVRRDQREHLIPFIADVVRRIDRERRQLIIDPLPGLLED